jgi:hypothetical protein
MRKSQQGTSYVGILLIIVCVVVFGKILVAVWTPYLDDRILNNEIAEVIRSSPPDVTAAQFKQKLSQRLSVNNVKDVDPEKVINVTTYPSLVVKKNYEVRKPFLLNIDLVLKFEKYFDQSSVQAK